MILDPGGCDSRMQDDSDHALLAAVARSDSEAFEQLYRRYELRVGGYLRSIVRDATMAEDLVVETMTDVWRNASRFESKSLVSTWIFGIARHKAIDAMRKAARSNSGDALQSALAVPDPSTGPPTHAQRQDVRRIMEKVVAELSPEHQEILRLAFFEEMPYEQIAVLLGIPANTVKSRVYYAKEHLRELLARYGQSQALRG